jgi:hypothetical protein
MLSNDCSVNQDDYYMSESVFSDRIHSVSIGDWSFGRNQLFHQGRNLTYQTT